MRDSQENKEKLLTLDGHISYVFVMKKTFISCGTVVYCFHKGLEVRDA